jgi:hypothetical protein
MFAEKPVKMGTFGFGYGKTQLHLQLMSHSWIVVGVLLDQVSVWTLGCVVMI